jgi:hypothetical protein
LELEVGEGSLFNPRADRRNDKTTKEGVSMECPTTIEATKLLSLFGR